ncbi:MAG: hypothetical protein ACO2Z9_11040 [Crocinitomicaceae bacterium]
MIVSLSAGILSWGFADRIEADHSILYGIFVFFGTLSVYNLQRLFKVSQASILTPWLAWVKENRKLVITISVLSCGATLTALWLIYPDEVLSIAVLTVAGVFGLFYVVRIKGKNLRAIPFFKIHAISITWSLLIAVFPLINEGDVDMVLPVFLAHYIYTLAVTIPFDIRDLKYDDITYKTIPQMLGVNGAKWLALLLLAGYIVLMYFVYPELIFSPWFWTVMLVTAGLVMAVNEKVSDWYCAGLIDGSIGLLGLVYLLA